MIASRTRPLLALSVVPVLCVLLGVVGWRLDWHLGVDETVYRSGAIALLRGEPLYARLFLDSQPSWAQLPFTYPPTAALLFLPLVLVPTQVAWGLLAAASIVATSVVVLVTSRALPDRPQWMTGPKVVVLLAIVALGLEPVWRTLALGQINLLLMAMIVLDVLLIGVAKTPMRRFGGVLIGIAAAVKLTPLIFVAHLLVTGRRADALRAIGTFAVLQGGLFLLIPGDVRAFWGDAVRDPHRIGPIHQVGNQSINGLVLRLTGNADWSLAAALAVGAVLAVPCVLLVRRLHQRRRPVPALLVTAFLGLLVSPVSWSHHWVWVVPLVVFLLARVSVAVPKLGWASRFRFGGAASVVLIFSSCVLIFLHYLKAETDWGALDFVVGSAYLLVPLVAGATVLLRR
ncbi:MAG: glycosyltransferase 87 family protein, partial [Actinomycetota bacterium]|nr:glycosyltransferase 87 family protein [Actinomycetota bacterium]